MDILKKLQAMGVNIQSANNLPSRRRAVLGIEQCLDGKWIESHGNRIFFHQTIFPYGSKYGKITLMRSEDYKNHNKFWQPFDIGNLNPDDFLFFDIETSSITIGTGTLVFLFGASHFSDNGLEVIQVFMEDPTQEEYFLVYLQDLLMKFKCLVTYNGKSFDIPILQTRYLMNKNLFKVNGFPHIDLLHTSRKIWKYRLESKRLADIENHILAFYRRKDEIPGWLIPQIYQDYLQTGDALPLTNVFYHNEMDVVSLAVLFLEINHMIAFRQSDVWEYLSIGEIYKKANQFEQAEMFFNCALEKAQNNFQRTKILQNLAQSLKKQHTLEEAAEIWMELAKYHDITAYIELAKYYEHVEKDFIKALECTKNAVELVINNESEDASAIENLLVRRRRLEKKILNNKK